MIGYGLADTSVESIDRRSDDVLVFGVKTTENDLVGNLGTPSEAGSVMTYDPASDTYLWYKVVEPVDFSYRFMVFFSPDGNRVLLHYQDGSATDVNPALLFLNAADGAQLGTQGMRKVYGSGQVYARDSLTMNNDGSKVYWLH